MAQISRESDTPLRQQVYDALKTDILNGTLSAGQILSEEALAERYGASRTPVREVLTTLGRDGLVQYFPRRGYQVTQFSMDDVIDVFQVRMMLEPEAAYLAAKRMTPEDVAELETLARDIAASSVPAESNLRLHHTIALFSGNRLLAELVQQVNEKIWVFGKAYLAPLDPRKSDLSHFGIIEALRTGDGEAARTAMRGHLEHTQQRLGRRVL